jgi:long-chain acyl-CoA synthetase
VARLLAPHLNRRSAAIIDDTGPVGWAVLDARVDRLIHVLRELASGSRVALVHGNAHEGVEVVVAALHAGMAVVPVNWHLGRDEIAHILADSDARLVVVDPARRAVVRAAADLLERPVRLLVTGAGGSYEAMLALLAEPR